MKTKQLHILKIISIIFIIVNLACCSKLSSLGVKEGIYAFEKPSKLKLMYYNYFHNSSFTLGDTLNILKDKNFTFLTCGALRFGTYFVKNDSLFLNYDSTLVLRDKRMNYFKYSDSFYIQDEETLIMTFKSKISKESIETFNTITELYYIED